MRLLGCLACLVSAVLVVSLFAVPIRAWPDPAPFEAYLRPGAAWGVCLVLIMAAGCALAQPRLLVGAAGRALAVLGLAVALLWPAYALAQAAADTAVELGGLFGDMRSTIEAVILAVLALGVALLSFGLKKYLGLNIDGKMRDALQSALTDGVHLGLDRIQASADGVSVDVKSTTIASSVQYVRVIAPKAVKHFRLDEEALADMVRAKLVEQLPAEARAGILAPHA